MDAREFTNGMHLIPLDQDKEPTCGRGFLDEANYEQNTQKVIPGEMYGVLTGRPNRVLVVDWDCYCLLYTSPSPRDATLSRMPSSA